MLIDIALEERRLARCVGSLQCGHFLLAERQLEGCDRICEVLLLRRPDDRGIDTAFFNTQANATVAMATPRSAAMHSTASTIALSESH